MRPTATSSLRLHAARVRAHRAVGGSSQAEAVGGQLLSAAMKGRGRACRTRAPAGSGSRVRSRCRSSPDFWATHPMASRTLAARARRRTRPPAPRPHPGATAWSGSSRQSICRHRWAQQAEHGARARRRGSPRRGRARHRGRSSPGRVASIAASISRPSCSAEYGRQRARRRPRSRLGRRREFITSDSLIVKLFMCGIVGRQDETVASVPRRGRSHDGRRSPKSTHSSKKWPSSSASCASPPTGSTKPCPRSSA